MALTGAYNVPYRYDFCIDDEDGDIICLIEFDGLQHFEPIPYYGGIEGLDARKKNDRIKNWYAYQNQIPLIRIRYDEIECVEEIITSFLEK